MTGPMSVERALLLRRVAEMIPRVDDLGRNIFVGVDGVDGSGKTMFADELASSLASLQPTVRISIDGFHKQRADRYRLGRNSPQGFWEDSYDYEAFERFVLAPLTGDGRTYIPASHDLNTDELLTGPRLELERSSVVVVDGIFLHREELRRVWDFSIFLEVDFAVSVARMALRDGSSPDPGHPSNRRYVDGQRLYFDSCAPWALASINVDNNDLSAPAIVEVRV